MYTLRERGVTLLKKEYDYFEKNKKELVRKYNGKFIVIKNEQVLGVYDTEKEAYDATSKEHEIGTFLIQRCIQNEEELVQSFHTRAIF